jgi:hypothetical protein
MGGWKLVEAIGSLCTKRDGETLMQIERKLQFKMGFWLHYPQKY